jgi:hypothetical protein
MADPGVLPQEGNQGVIRGIQHHYDQLSWQSAENYSAFRQDVYGALQDFAVFLEDHRENF